MKTASLWLTVSLVISFRTGSSHHATSHGKPPDKVYVPLLSGMTVKVEFLLEMDVMDHFDSMDDR